MYLRAGNLPKDFAVERKRQTVDTKGRVRVEYETTEPEYIRAVLAQASTAEKERWNQLQHPITHTLVQRGRPKAAEGDRLIHLSRTFYIQGADEIAELGIATLYYVEERRDTGADNDKGNE